MKKNILITNGRFPATLDLIRNLSNCGSKIIVAETSLFHYCATSNANAKNYLIPSPRECEEGYIQRILEIIDLEKIDLFIPGWEDALIVSKHLHRFNENVAFTSDFSTLDSLHNKWEFHLLLKGLGFNSAKSYLIDNESELNTLPFSSFYLKYIYSRGTEGTFFVKNLQKVPKIQINRSNPILVQEKLKGQQYCTYSICHNGKIKAHATYPLHYQSYNHKKTRGNYCLSFEEIEHKEIFSFVCSFVEKINYTGSIAFDIFDENGIIIPLECNPRITSGITLLTSKNNLINAFFNTNKDIIFPEKGIQKQLFLPSLLFASKSAISNGSFAPFIKTLFFTKDLIFNIKDLKPFFFQPFIALHQFYLKYKYKKSIISSYSHDLDYEG